MFPVLFLLLLVLPIAELYVIVQVGQQIGILPTIVLLIGVSVVGAWLLKREGLATWRRFQATMRRGQVPAKEATDGALILLGGALLMTPGFISDIVGLMLVLPPTRALVKNAFRRFIGGMVLKRAGAPGFAAYAGKRIYDTRASRTRSMPAESVPPPHPEEPTN